MATLVAFHAHPDDECLLQSGSLAKAVDAGHRVVVVYATGGELGQVPDGLLDPGERLVDRRRREAEGSAAATGAQRVVWLGYHDSGMDGAPENDDPACFWRADVEAAARRLADILEGEQAEVVTFYDPHGNYGHPDHVQVHRVGVRAAELAGTPHAFEVTWSREMAMRLMADARRNGIGGFDADDTDVDLNLEDPNVTFGVLDAEITTRVDVVPWLDRKRAAIEAHASQVGDTGPFLSMPLDMFVRAMGTEYYVRRGAPLSTRDDDIFAGLA